MIWLIVKITSIEIGEIILTEIPDVDIDPRLFEKNMIYDPCGAIYNNSRFIKDEKCMKRYSRNVHTEFVTGNNGYLKYRQRSIENGGHFITPTITLKSTIVRLCHIRYYSRRRLMHTLISSFSIR